MRIRSTPVRALLPALLLAAAACVDVTEPQLGGEYVGSLDSPFSVEGAAIVEITSADLREIRSPGRIMVARGTSERTVRILLMNPPRNLNGGPITFRVRMAGGAVPPTAVVIAASGPTNNPRDFVGGYAVRWSQTAPAASASASAGPDPLDQVAPPVAPVSFLRAVAPFFPGGLPLAPPEVTRLDGAAGNMNRVYDLGDLRGYLAQFPGEIPPETVWSR
ncbi:MAG TPA: hypothetical protein VF006_17705 [Longimicrobium sp.]